MINSKQVSKSNQTSKEPLSKEAKRFNNLLALIEKKERKLEEIRLRLDESLNECVEQVIPLLRTLCDVRAQTIICLCQIVRAQRMSILNRELLVSCIQDRFNDIIEAPFSLSDDLIDQVHQEIDATNRFITELNGDTYVAPNPDDERHKLIEAAKKNFEDALRAHNIQVNLDELHSGLSDEEILNLINQKMKDLEQHTHYAETPKGEKKKNKKQQEKEAAIRNFDDLKEKNFAGLYKKLAKLIHPDTAVDEASRAVKLEWMKRLTAAYQSKDLKTMLMIELEWLKVESSKIESLSEEHLSYYNSFLNEQVNDLQNQIINLPYDPRYQSIVYFTLDASDFKSWNTKKIKNNLLIELEIEKEILDQLAGNEILKKKAIKDLIENQKDIEEEKELFLHLKSLYTD